jgi:hypothetical protein
MAQPKSTVLIDCLQDVTRGDCTRHIIVLVEAATPEVRVLERFVCNLETQTEAAEVYIRELKSYQLVELRFAVRQREISKI